MRKLARNPAPDRRPHKDVWGLPVVIAGVVFVYCLLPLGTALQFGGDEGYQLIAGLLNSKGYVLYRQIWYDQPPLFILLLGGLMKAFGPAVLFPRLLAADFGLILFWAFYQLVSLRSRPWAAWLAVFFLLASPGILELSVSVMQEGPAFAIGLVSVGFLFAWSQHRQWPWLAASGITMGIAMGIKLTVLLLAPAMLVEMALASRDSNILEWGKKSAWIAFQWLVVTGIAFAVILVLWGRGSIVASFKSHVMEHPVAGQGGPADHPLPWSIFVTHGECVLAALAALMLIIWKKRWRECSFPVALLLTVTVIHIFHRPWWIYYYIHFAIPIAWLAGFAGFEIISLILGIFSGNRFDIFSPRSWGGIVLCACVAVVLVFSEERLVGSIKLMQNIVPIQHDPVVAKMREYAGRTHWVYVESGFDIYPFQAGLLMPPELANVHPKRYWSGQITEAEIVQTCRRYQVEQVVLSPKRMQKEWQEFLNDYQPVYQTTNVIVYIAKRIEL